MDRNEAAQFLGVSLRTLDRLSASGRLTKGRELRKTRPCVVFDEAELQALRSEIGGENEPRGAFRREAVQPKDTVAFRLDQHYRSRLQCEGQSLGMSPGEYARHLVIQSLEDARQERIFEEVHRLREALADTVFVFLTTKCGTSESAADDFVRETILKDA